MKTTLLILLSVVFAGFSQAADKLPQSPEALLSAWQKAIEGRDEKMVITLLNFDQTDPQILAGQGEYARQLMDRMKGAEFSLKPAEENSAFPLVMGGKKIEFVPEPEGQLSVKMKPYNTSTEFPYARVDGGYKFVAQRATKLNWAGPADVEFSFAVSSKSPANPEGPLTLKIRYNASGVILEKKLILKTASDSISGGFMGQRVTEIEIVENKGPARLFEVQNVGGKTTVFKDEIPSGWTGLIYTETTGSKLPVSASAK